MSRTYKDWFPKPSVEVRGPAGKIRIATEDVPAYQGRGYEVISGTEYYPVTDSPDAGTQTDEDTPSLDDLPEADLTDEE